LVPGRPKNSPDTPEGFPMPGRRFLPVLMIFCMTISAAATEEKVEAAKVKVEVHLSAEHAPEAIKVKSRVDLVYVKSAIKTRTGKAKYMTAPLAKDAEVASIKREKNPADPAKAVRVELLVTKEQAARIEKMKKRVVTVVESEGGKAVTKKRPVPLRLELAKPKQK